jgi:hypothetical protein
MEKWEGGLSWRLEHSTNPASEDGGPLKVVIFVLLWLSGGGGVVELLATHTHDTHSDRFLTWDKLDWNHCSPQIRVSLYFGSYFPFVVAISSSV